MAKLENIPTDVLETLVADLEAKRAEIKDPKAVSRRNEHQRLTAKIKHYQGELYRRQKEIDAKMRKLQELEEERAEENRKMGIRTLTYVELLAEIENGNN